MSNVMTTIRKRTIRKTQIVVGCGIDVRYHLRLSIDPELGVDDVAADGIDRMGCELVLGGTNYNTHSEDQEVTVQRFLGEDELRAMGKAMILAAGKLRRFESDARRRKQKKGPVK